MKEIQRYIPLHISRKTLLTLLAASTVSVALGTSPSRLAVGIIVDGLEQEQINQLRKHLGNDGFNRFLNNGVVLENVDYGPGLDAAAATAVIMTGASPSVNGIPSEMRYDETARRMTAVLDDRTTVGNFTQQTFSPRALRTATIADEARIAGAGVTYAYSVAVNPSQAIVMAGHAGNSAVWLNDKTANWAGSTFYPDFPLTVTNRNRLSPLISRLDTMQWVPSAISASAALLPEHLTRYPFRHTFGRGNADRIEAFKASPKANEEITAIATDYIKTLELGKHAGIDMISVAYSLQPYEFGKTSENRYEAVDAYVKLDAQIARLLNTVYSTVGNDNAIVFLAATPSRRTRRRDDEKWNIPYGEFSTRKAISLLNLYLIAIHGNGEWVTGYDNRQFFVNRKLADERSLDLRLLRQQVADFLKRMSGIERAYTIDDILDNDAPVENPDALRRNTVIDFAGDVNIDVMPGWEIVNDANTSAMARGNVNVSAMTTAPVYLILPGVEPRVISNTIDARAIAPTITGAMRIRAPNGSSVPPLRF